MAFTSGRLIDGRGIEQGSFGAPPSITRPFPSQQSAVRSGRRNKAKTSLGQDVISGNIGGILDRQINETDDVRRKAEQDRIDAIGQLQGITSGEGYQSAYNQLSGDRQKSPFEQMLEKTLGERISNPDVISGDQMAQWLGVNQDQISKAVNDAMFQSRTGAASRGVSGGVSDRALQDLQLRGVGQLNQSHADLLLQAAQARQQNLSQAQGTAEQLVSSGRTADNTRSSQLLDLISRGEIDSARAIADIIANTDRSAPDYSGFASIAMDLQNAERADAQNQQALQLLQQQLYSGQESPLTLGNNNNGNNNTDIQDLINGLFGNRQASQTNKSNASQSSVDPNADWRRRQQENIRNQGRQNNETRRLVEAARRNAARRGRQPSLSTTGPNDLRQQAIDQILRQGGF